MRTGQAHSVGIQGTVTEHGVHSRWFEVKAPKVRAMQKHSWGAWQGSGSLPQPFVLCPSCSSSTLLLNILQSTIITQGHQTALLSHTAFVRTKWNIVGKVLWHHLRFSVVYFSSLLSTLENYHTEMHSRGWCSQTWPGRQGGPWVVTWVCALFM